MTSREVSDVCIEYCVPTQLCKVTQFVIFLVCNKCKFSMVIFLGKTKPERDELKISPLEKTQASCMRWNHSGSPACLMQREGGDDGPWETADSWLLCFPSSSWATLGAATVPVLYKCAPHQCAGLCWLYYSVIICASASLPVTDRRGEIGDLC